MSTIIIVVSLTEVCSSLVVSALCFAGVDVVGGSKSNGILVSAEAMLTLSVTSPSCFLQPWYHSVARYHHGQDSKIALLVLLAEITTNGQASTHIG